MVGEDPAPLDSGRVSSQSSNPTPEQIMEAFHVLGTKTSVATFFGVSRRTVDRWVESFNLIPELRPEIPINQFLSSLLSDLASRVRVAQWIVDEASISVAHNSRYDTSSLLVTGAMNDNRAMDAVAEELGVTIISGGRPQEGRLPTHIIKIQCARAYGLLSILCNELTGLKAVEAKAALSFFPASGLVRGKTTTDAYMAADWRRFATESFAVWNSKRRNKLSSVEIERMVEAWILNRTARARRGLTAIERIELHDMSTSATPRPSRPSPRT
jgi:hypothetical protein